MKITFYLLIFQFTLLASEIVRNTDVVYHNHYLKCDGSIGKLIFKVVGIPVDYNKMKFSREDLLHSRVEVTTQWFRENYPLRDPIKLRLFAPSSSPEKVSLYQSKKVFNDDMRLKTSVKDSNFLTIELSPYTFSNALNSYVKFEQPLLIKIKTEDKNEWDISSLMKQDIAFKGIIESKNKKFRKPFHCKLKDDMK